MPLRRVWPLLLLFVSCAVNPVTGKRQLSLIGESQEIQIGKEGAAEVVESIGLVESPQLQTYVSDIGRELAKGTERPKLPWTFQVVDDASVNAFALPGGYIFVTRGLLTHLNNEAELASVLGHEIGHVTAKHSVNQLSKATLAQVGLGLGAALSERIANVAQVAGAGLTLLFLKFGRDAEKQADELGFRYALADNYDVREMAGVFDTLKRVSEAEKGGGRLPEWLSTHPDPENRVEAAKQRVAGLKRDLSGTTVDRPEYLRLLNGLAYGEDPRLGFFEGDTFYHPKLKFQFAFPPGWKHQNQPQAVIGASEAGDAAIQLGVAGTMPPEQALRDFLSREGIRPGKAAAGEVGDFPGVAGAFEAQAEQGVVVRGVAVFVSHEGKTFGLLGYSLAERFASYVPQLRAAFGSFKELTDPQMLKAEPARLEIVEVGEAMTLEQFTQRHPSSVPKEKVALVNGMPLTQQLAPGSLVKRIVGGFKRADEPQR